MSSYNTFTLLMMHLNRFIGTRISQILFWVLKVALGYGIFCMSLFHVLLLRIIVAVFWLPFVVSTFNFHIEGEVHLFGTGHVNTDGEK